jgi:hypothetical protein
MDAVLALFFESIPLAPQRFHRIMFSQPLATGGYNSTYFTPQPNSTDPYLQYGQPQQQALHPQYAALRPQLGNANALALRGPRNNFQGAHPSSVPTNLFKISSVVPSPTPPQPSTFAQNIFQPSNIHPPYLHFHYLPSQTNIALQQQNVSAPHAQANQSHPAPSPAPALSASTSSESAYTGDLQYPGPFSAESDTIPLAGLTSSGSTYTGDMAPTQYPVPFSVESDSRPLAGPSTLTSPQSTYTGELAPIQYPGPFSVESDTRPLAGPTRQPKARRARTQAYTRPPTPAPACPGPDLPLRCALSKVGGPATELCGAVFDSVEQAKEHVGRDGEHGLRNDKQGKEKFRCTWEGCPVRHELTGSGGLLRHIKEVHLGIRRDRKPRRVEIEGMSVWQLPEPVAAER